MSLEHSPQRGTGRSVDAHGVVEQRNVAQGVLSEYMEEDELAAELNCSPRTIQRWHRLREGPPRTKIGKRVFYRRNSVADWLRSREQAFDV